MDERSSQTRFEDQTGGTLLAKATFGSSRHRMRIIMIGLTYGLCHAYLLDGRTRVAGSAKGNDDQLTRRLRGEGRRRAAWARVESWKKARRSSSPVVLQQSPLFQQILVSPRTYPLRMQQMARLGCTGRYVVVESEGRGDERREGSEKRKEGGEVELGRSSSRYAGVHGDA